MKAEANRKSIYPTHHCFDDALEILAALNSGERQTHLRLVHSICRAPDGNLYAHAHVNDIEKRESYFRGIYLGCNFEFIASTEEYEAGLHIVEAIRYTVSEAIAENRKSGNYGPWIERYQQLCGTSGKTWE